MKRIVLDNTISLNAVMSGAPATNQPTFTIAWADKSSGNPFVLGFDRGSLSGVTEKELVGAPASGTDRVIRSFSIVNIDTADVTIKLYTDDASTEIELPEITLNPGDELTEEGVFDSNGKKKIASSASAAEIASSINNSSEKTTPVDGDKIPILDSAASFVLKWFSWANIKSALASATQTLTNKTLTSRSNEIHAEEVYAEVRNASGVVISKGDVVYASGYNVGADLVEVDLADADDGTKMPALGLSAEDISDNSTGKVAIIGILEDIDTSAYSVGDMLYVSTTPGELTGTAPTTDDSHVQHIGTVFRSNANTGAIEVQINPHPLKIVPTLDSDAVSKKHADTKANLSGGNEFSGLQEFQDGISFDGGTNIFNVFETGLHTVTVTPGSSGTVTLDSSKNTSSYIKFNDWVFNIGLVVVDSVSSPTGYFTVSTPFTLSGDREKRAQGLISVNGGVSANVSDYTITGTGVGVRVYLGDAPTNQSDSAQELQAGSNILIILAYRTG